MPEGLTSIDDLKVVITAETEKFAAGLGNAQELLSRFTADGSGKLSAFDGAMTKFGGTVQSLSGAMTNWLTVAQNALSIVESIGEKAEVMAKKLGAEEEWNTFRASIDGITQSIKDLMSGADTSTASTAYLKRNVDDLSNSFTSAGLSAEGFAKRALATLTDQMERAAHEARRFTSEDTWKTHTIDAEIRRTQELIENFKKRIDSIAESGTNWFERLLGVDDQKAIGKLRSAIDHFEVELDRLGALRVKSQWKDVEVDTGGAELLKGLEREVEALRLRAAVLGMNAAEAAVFVASEKIRQDAAATGKKVDEEATAALLGRMRAYRMQIDGFAEAERQQRQAQQEGQRQERGRDGILEGLDRELSAIKAKERGLSDLSAATKAQEIEERVLAQARQRNITVTDEMALQIKAYAGSIAEADTTLREHQRNLQQVQQATGVVFRGVETIISRSLDGSKLKMREVMASMLNDLSALIMKMMVLKPLEQAISGGIAGGAGGASSLFSGLGSLISGTRAMGGPVGAGETYLVGENGPELFTASRSGTIVANDRLRAAAGGGAVHVTIQNHVNAAGAYPESIEDIRRALADENARLPGRVLEVVSDARERGGLG
jgi:hypothetical protein